MRNATNFAILVLIISITGLSQQQPKLDRKALAAQTRSEFTYAWESYKKYASGYDELLPVSHTGRNWNKDQTLYMTPVDSLDTLLIMGMKDEADKTRTLIAEKLS